MYVHACFLIHVCVCVCMYVCMHACMHACMYYIRMYVYDLMQLDKCVDLGRPALVRLFVGLL
jgi:hypothetical protein